MYVIIGLGNPGRKYKKSRHNLGFLVIDELAKRYNIPLIEKSLYEIGEARLSHKKTIIVKPLTYMNRSGRAVEKLFRSYNIKPSDLIVVHDDIDMETGKLRVKNNGSSGGHRGIQSIIDSLGSKNFIRIKIGIGRDYVLDPSDYVLQNFKSAEMILINEAIQSASDTIESIISKGIVS